MACTGDGNVSGRLFAARTNHRRGLRGRRECSPVCVYPERADASRAEPTGRGTGTSGHRGGNPHAGTRNRKPNMTAVPHCADLTAARRAYDESSGKPSARSRYPAHTVKPTRRGRTEEIFRKSKAGLPSGSPVFYLQDLPVVFSLCRERRRDLSPSALHGTGRSEPAWIRLPASRNEALRPQ